MPRWIRSSIVLSTAVLALTAAQPTRALLLPASATFGIEIGVFPPVVMSFAGSLNATTSAGKVTGFTVPAGVVATTVAQPVTPPIVLIPGISITHLNVAAANGAGNFTQTGMSSGTGVMSPIGTASLLLQAYGTPSSVVLPLTGAFGVPGGKVTSKVLNLVPVTILANGWTLGTVFANPGTIDSPGTSTFTRMGSHSTATFATGGPSANIVRDTNLNYVTATLIIIGGVGNIASFGTLSVQFQQVIGHVAVPEPGTLVLLGSGLLILGLAECRLRRA